HGRGGRLLALQRDQRVARLLVGEVDADAAARRERSHHDRDDRDDVLVKEAPARVQSMSSSARSSTAWGIVMPSAFAVLRLMVNLNCRGSSIAISAGFSPLRMRTT